MMKGLVWISRLVIGTLFILSGLIKANDPHGFAYKLEEYFEVFSADLTTKVSYQLTEEGQAIQDEPCAGKIMEDLKEKVETPIPVEEQGGVTRMLVGMFSFFAGHALSLAIFICVLEILLGAYALFGFGLRPVSWLLLGMIVFFTFLTFYSAYFNKVTDCGCFGDALKLTPWQSFWKDIFLLVFILPIWIWNRKIKVSPKADGAEWALGLASVAGMAALVFFQFDWWLPFWFLLGLVVLRGLMGQMQPKRLTPIVGLGAVLASAVFGVYTQAYEPVRDYRPWRVGNDIPALRISKPDRVQTDFLYLRKSDCEQVRKSPDKEGWDWYTLEFEAEHLFWKQDQVVLEKGEEAKVKDLSLYEPETEIPFADSLFTGNDRVFFFVFHQLSKVNLNVLPQVKAIATAAQAAGFRVMGGAAATSEEILAFQATHQLPFALYINDEKPLKTILRSNPGLVELQGGKVMNKWAGRALPTASDLGF